ncbi:helix-turn-helix domain-containing protein [Microbacterium sp. KSW4-11]|uniref:Helix-turn-helix domain-containing protein n=1 Tax=Microbacterium gawkjiense TaxID=3067309 RepID=A0ABU3GF80_9MICO|nr:helix-turn-helix domain-containing protein [Microbacterium sp. KSW4-11]MDT3318121.1 helix-turn-helix domain-containing protein [Microbacterium sp. KSW4-11]
MSEEDYWAQFPDTLTTADVAKIIRTGAPAVRSRLRDGIIPGHRIADSWIMFKAEIRAWLASTSNRPSRPTEPVDVLTDYPDELSYRDLMRLFRVKYKGTIYIWLEQGHIPGSLVGNRWVVHKWQLRDLLEETSNQRLTPPPFTPADRPTA